MVPVVAARSTSGTRSGGHTTARTSATKRPRRTQGPSDAITLLKADHKTVEELFKQFERSSASAHKARRKLVDKMITELSMHAAIEEQFLYPQARREVPDATPDILEAMEEHHVVKWLLSELDHADPADERFDAKVRVLMESVRHHVREEEQELFPELHAALGRTRLREIGAQLAEGKRLAPTHPHPRSPAEPPANLIVGAFAGAIDRARDKVSTRPR